MAARTASRLAGFTGVELLMTLETVLFETLARLAMSVIVVFFLVKSRLLLRVDSVLKLKYRE